jgi:polar amino acid transport system substrate-binding protein
MRTFRPTAVAIALIALLAACTPGASPSPSATTSPTGTPATSPSAAASAPATSPSAAASECSAENLETKTAGQLTIGTDNPAYPPYFQPPAEGETAPEPWSEGIGDPTNGRGFESAVAYAIAEELGFSRDQVEWIYVPFANSYAPGEKEFDFDINQISYTDERAQAVDMSEGYYFLNQALVAITDSPITEATSVADLKEYRLGAQVGTTSLAYIQEEIQPTAEASVYDTNDAAISALNAGQIDGIVVDLPTAFFITAAQMDGKGTIVGQFPAAEGEQEHFSLVLEKDSPLTDCVNEAIAALEENGELESITQEWLSEAAGAPEFTQ